MGELQKFHASQKKLATQSTNPNGRKTTAQVADANARLKRSIGQSEGVDMLAYPMDTAGFAQGHYVIFQLHTLTNGKLVKQDAPGGQNRSFALQKSSKRVGTQIALYMPPQVSVKYGLKYGDVNISAAAEDAANVAGSLKEGELLASAGNAVGGVATLAQKAVGKIGGGITDTFTTGLKELTFIKSGKIVTDKMELLFEGVDRRSFTFEFTFIPKSPEEANQVFLIVNSFKIAMLPKYTESFNAVAAAIGIDGSSGISDLGRDRTLTIPTTMDIKYYMQKKDGTAKENGYLNKISTCYLKSMDIKYGGDRYTAYEEDFRGASPQSTSVTMEFAEIEIITKEAALQGY